MLAVLPWRRSISLAPLPVLTPLWRELGGVGRPVSAASAVLELPRPRTRVVDPRIADLVRIAVDARPPIPCSGRARGRDHPGIPPARNVGCSEATTTALLSGSKWIAARHRSKVTIVGHSRGGLMARVLARRRPDRRRGGHARRRTASLSASHPLLRGSTASRSAPRASPRAPACSGSRASAAPAAAASSCADLAAPAAPRLSRFRLLAPGRCRRLARGGRRRRPETRRSPLHPQPHHGSRDARHRRRRRQARRGRTSSGRAHRPRGLSLLPRRDAVLMVLSRRGHLSGRRALERRAADPTSLPSGSR